nr:MAG TPA: hypothetical protein [Caudoviricetes sp.]
MCTCTYYTKYMGTCLVNVSIEIHGYMYYNNIIKKR